MIRLPLKDPTEVLDYYLDYSSEFINNGLDTIVSCGVEILTDETVPPLVVEQSGFQDNKMIYFWLSGGLVETDYSIDVTVTTALGRVFNDTCAVKIKNK
jgi:dUTPase